MAQRVAAPVLIEVLVEVLLGISLGCVGACNSLDSPAPASGTRILVPTDERATQQALTAPPPISGGTLAVSDDDHYAVAADPDRARVSIVDLGTRVVEQVSLDTGSEPGRVVVDDAGHAYVAMRRSGDVLSISLDRAQVEQRTHVCAAARGLALQAQAGLLHVACADGKLVSVRTSDLGPVRSLSLDGDLRDVLVAGDTLKVSRFKSAELLTIDSQGQVVARSEAGEFSVPVFKDASNDTGSLVRTPPEMVQQPMQAQVAWRTVLMPNGDVLMLDQGESEAEVDLARPSGANPNASPYGGSGFGTGCEGVVGPALTHFGPDGAVRTTGVVSGVLSVDMAIDTSGQQIAVVQAGSSDPLAPRPTVVTSDGLGATSVAATAPLPGFGGPFAGANFDPSQTQFSQLTVLPVSVATGGQCQRAMQVSVPGQATAVAFTHDGRVVIQSREPAQLMLTWPVASGPGESVTIDLGGPSVRDTGHDLFHRDAGGGIACASCHAEGAEDGHVWHFSGIGARRTQALHVGLEGTAPFHWNGDEADIGHLMEDVLVGRMGGVHQSQARVDSLTRWLFALHPPAAAEDPSSEAAVHGKQVFATAGCGGCHTGPKFTNNDNADVGTGAKLQVPSLIGVGYRAPYMHTGCAPTLAERFDPACGGDKHGHTSGLPPGDVDDLISYLRTL